VSKRRIYIAATGAGAGAQADIWRVPGCSAYFAGACFPYGHDQLEDFLGFAPERACCEDTSIEMAMMAYYRAWQPGTDAVGVGLSGAVASAKPRKGENRIHVALMTAEGVRAYHYGYENEHGAKAREWQGRHADSVIKMLLDRGRPLSGEVTGHALSLFLGRSYWAADGTRHATPPAHRALYPGAFNPPHQGHLAIAESVNAIHWIEATTPHKPPLALAEMVQRAKMLHRRDRLFTSGMPLYLDKSNAFPRRAIVIGADAFLRMLDPKWGPDPMDLLRKLADNDTTLKIVGREVNGRWVSAEEAIAAVPESGVIYNLEPLEGRWDISSSQLRA